MVFAVWGRGVNKCELLLRVAANGTASYHVCDGCVGMDDVDQHCIAMVCVVQLHPYTSMHVTYAMLNKLWYVWS